MPKTSVAIITAILMISILLISLPEETKAQSTATISLSDLSPNPQIASPTITAPFTVSFTGTVTVSGQGYYRMDITLSASCDQGWVTYPTPPTKSVMEGQTPSYSFTVTVTVPAGSPSTIVGKVTVVANGKSVYGTAPPDAYTYGSIQVNQYYWINIESELAYKEVPPGQMTPYTIKVWNRGNGPDNLRFEISNIKDLQGKGWALQLSKYTETAVPPQTYVLLTLQAQAPRDWTIWKTVPTQIMIKVTSSDDPTGSSQEYPVTVYERGWYISGFDPIFLIFALVFITVIFKKKMVREKK